MKRFLLISSILFSTSAFAGNNILSLSPGNATSNIIVGNIALLQDHPSVNKPKIDKVVKGKSLTTKKMSGTADDNPLEGGDGEVVDILPGDDGSNGGVVIIDDNGKVVEIHVDPREWDGFGLEPKCACIGIDHIPFDQLGHPTE